MNLLRRYICALLSLIIIVTGTCAFTEDIPEIPEETVTVQPTEAPDEPSVPETMEESPVPADEPTPEPTQTPRMTFKHDKLTVDVSETGKGFDYAKEFAIERINAGGKLIWDTSDHAVAAFVRYDKDFNAPDEDTPEEEIIVLFEAYTTGSVTVTARLSDDKRVNAEFELTITDESAALHIDKEKISAETGDVIELYVINGKGAKLDADDFVWTSDASCVRVENGVMTCLSAGSATVTATRGDDTAKTSVVVTGAEKSDITLPDVRFYTNSFGEIAITSNPPCDVSDAVFTVPEEYAGLIAVTDKGVVTAICDENGLIPTATGVFTAYVNVTLGDFSGQARVEVMQAATHIADDSPVELMVGKTADLTAMMKLEPENHMDRASEYLCDNSNLIKIDNVKATALADMQGTTNIKVKTLSGQVFTRTVRAVIGTEKITLTMPDEELLPGGNVQITAARQPSNADDTLTWTSSDETVACVDDKGNVSLIAPGSAVITVRSTLTGVSAEIAIVVDRITTGIAIYDDIFDLFTGYCIGKGQSVTPAVTVLPDGGDYSLVSADPSVAYIDGKTIIGKSRGVTKVVIISADEKHKRTIDVTVVPADGSIRSITVSPKKLTLIEGKGKKVAASVNYGAFSDTILWGSTDESVATVNAAGKIKAVSMGETFVYAMTLSGIGKKIKVTVVEQMPTEISINKTKLSKYADKNALFTCTLTPDAIKDHNKVLTWSSSNTHVAVVDQSGMVTTIAPGSAKITARTVNDLMASCTVTVKKRAISSITIENPYSELLVGGRYTLNPVILPADATKPKVTWTLSDEKSRKRADINPRTGEIYCKKTGKITVRATAADGSKAYAEIVLKIAAVPIETFELTVDGALIEDNTVITLPFGNTVPAVASTDPELYTEWNTTDPGVAYFDKGVITAMGTGSAVMTVTAAGLYTRTFIVKVPRDESVPDYRALVVNQYRVTGEKGYMPFSDNSAVGIKDALRRSVVGGVRYAITCKTSFTDANDLRSALSSTFRDADENDVSVIYLMSHGTYKDNHFRWHFSGGGKSLEYISGEDLVNAITGIKGHVVVLVCSCYSGGEDSDITTLPGLFRAADVAAPKGSSYSVICANDKAHKASYVDTVEDRSYDFYTRSLCKSLGWDMLGDASMTLMGDANKDGKVTVSELISSTKKITSADIADYIAVYGDVALNGAPGGYQEVNGYISPNAKNLVILGK